VEACQGTPVTITNTTDNNGLSIESWEWNFGDGQVSNISQPPPHGYLIARDYVVSLKAYANNGCADSIVKTVTLANYPTAEITTNAPLTFCEGDSVTLSVTYNSRYSYKWMVDGAPITGGDSSSFIPQFSGRFSVEVVNTSGNCITTSAQVNVVVKPSPDKPEIESANYIKGVCPGDNPIRLSASITVPGYSYMWIKNGERQVFDTLSYIELYEQGIYKLRARLGECSNESDTFNIILADSPEKPIIYVRGPEVWYLICSNATAFDYKWYCNGNLIEGARKYFYVAGNKVGLYQVSISNIQGCYTRSDIVAIPTGYTGTEETEMLDDISIYPNPTSGIITIDMENNIFGDVLISIVTEQGKEIRHIRSEKTTEHFITEIDLSSEPKGVYFIMLQIENYMETRKVVLE
jgi:hypothetical protein